MWFIILFIALPLMEIATFMEVGGTIGTPKTLILCLLTAIIGGYFVKKQGAETLFKAQKHIATGQMPLQEMFDGICLVVTGAMMITPGFVTDTIGFLLLIPPVRVLLRTFIMKSGRFKMQSHYASHNHEKAYTQQNDPDVIEADYEHIDTTQNKD